MESQSDKTPKRYPGKQTGRYLIKFKTTRPRANAFGSDASQMRGSGIATQEGKKDVLKTLKVRGISENRYQRIKKKTETKNSDTNPRLGQYVADRAGARVKDNSVRETIQFKKTPKPVGKDKPDTKKYKYKAIAGTGARIGDGTNRPIRPKF